MPQPIKELLNALDLSTFQWVGLREVVETTTFRSARDQKFEASRVNHTRGIMVEVLQDGQFAYSALTDCSTSGIRWAAENARNQAQVAARSGLHRFSRSERPASIAEYRTIVARPWSELSESESIERLIEITRKLKKNDSIVRTRAILQLVESRHHWVSSSGADVHQHFFLTTHDFEATAQKEAITQRRTRSGLYGCSYQGGLESFLSSDLEQQIDKVADQALELIHAEECPTGTMDLMVMPDQMMLQIHESIGHPLELDRILGDERNYAGWSFVKPSDFGRLQYGSPLMNVSFDPTLTQEFASYAVDDIGNPAKKEFLIREGVLLRGLGSLESQNRLSLPGVANARASSWNRPPIDRMANLNLEPGQSSLEEMIGSVRKGVLVESNRSWSIDDYRNKFQFGCEYGRLIEDGRITRTVRNPNYRGVTVPFWNSLSMVGNQRTFGVFGTPFCGKGEPNQVIRVGHASPICLFKNIEIFGGVT